MAGLGRLSEPYRQVVVCRYLLDLDEAETASVLGVPRGTVKSRLRRALDQLARTVGVPRDTTTPTTGGEA